MVNRSSREIENMTLTTSQDLTPELMGRSLTERALSLALRGTTDMAPSVLPVPLSYYGDEEQLQREIAILRSVPLVVVPSAQVAAPNDFVVRQVLDTSL